VSHRRLRVRNLAAGGGGDLKNGAHDELPTLPN